MKKLSFSESGRTVLEVLAILLVMCVLTLGGLTGYNFLMTRYQRLETAREIGQLVTALKTTDVARKYSAGEVIPVRELVKGPETTDNGLIMKLPDGEDSYAVVTAMEGGAYAISLQMQPGTSSFVLETLGEKNLSLFEGWSGRLTSGALKNNSIHFVDSDSDGVKAKKRANEETKAIEKREELLSTALSTGIARYVTGCSEGSSSYNYVYGQYCNECPRGQKEDLNHQCCAAYACGQLCSCPDGTVCDAEKQQCVTCTKDEHCWAVNNNAFNKHVCRTESNTCVECLADLDCHSSIGPQNPNPDAKFCSNMHCVECRISYSTTATDEAMCPYAKPHCSSGKCEACPEGTVWDTTYNTCVCPDGLVLNPKTNECVKCYDSNDRFGRDAGCPSTQPICDEEGSTSFTFPGGTTKPVKGECMACTIDAQCPTALPNYYCDTSVHACAQCPTDKPYWDAERKICVKCFGYDRGASSNIGCAPQGWWAEDACDARQIPTGECYECMFDYGVAEEPEGCYIEMPICENNRCYLCQDTEPGNGIDNGCKEPAPICLDNPNGTPNRRHCVECTESAHCANKEGRPVCNTQTNTCQQCPEGQIWNPNTQKCVYCYDSVPDHGKDAGCDKDPKRPYCNEAGNGGMGICIECDGHYQSNTPFECTQETPVCKDGDPVASCKTCQEASNLPLFYRGQCVKCYDNTAQNGKDEGCGIGSDENKPICADAAGAASGPFATGASGNIGTNCYECLNNGHCPTDKPYCINHACVTCGGNDHCIDSTGKCIAVNSYDDIKRGSNGQCECLASVGTQSINDTGHSYEPSGGWDKTCERRSSSRQRLYSIPVNFYCPRYMHAKGSADDFVVSSSPAGIGTTSPAVRSASWQYAHDNSITPTVSNSTIQKGTATLVVQDRWLREMGYSGYFFFTTTKNGSGSADGKLRVTASWNSGSSVSGPIGGWLKKDGQSGCSGGSSGGSTGGSSGGSSSPATGSTCFYASGDASWAHNCGYPSGRVHGTHCFTKAWPASNTPKASCSISSDKHTVKVKNGRCNANFYEGRNCK